MAITTNGLQLARIAGAVFNQQLSASDYSEILASNKTAAELDAWANAAVAAEFRNKTTTDIAKAVLANVGLSSVAGLEAWVAGQLNAGGGVAKAGASLLAMLNDYSNMSTSDATYGASVVTFNAKTANSQALSQTAGTPTGTYAAVSAVASAKTFTLTTGTDNVVGTSGGDTIDGQLNASGSQTYSAADAIDGGAGEDSLVIRVGAGTYVASTLKNVETVSVQATGAAVLNVVNSSGIKTLKNAASSDTVEFRAVDATTAVEIANTASTNTVTYKSASLSGTSDSATIKVDGLTGALTVADVDASLTDAFAAETIALTTTGTASTVGTLTVTSIGATKLTVSGEANLTVTTFTDGTTGGPTLKTIDASAATGSVSITGAHNTASQAGNTITGGSGNDTLGGGDGNDVISGGAGNDSITAGAGVDNLTGGAGNDTFDLAGNLTSSDTVDGGDGTDTLVSTAAITGTSGSKVSGIETVSTSAAVEISAASVSGVATLRSTQNAGGTTTFSNMAGTETINIRTAAGGDDNVTATKATDSTTDSQTVTIGNSSGSTAVVLGTLTLNDAETISITSSLVPNTVTTLTSSDVTKLTVAGIGLTVTNFTSSSVLKTIDASTSSGAFIMGNAIGTSSVTLTGGTENDTLIGSAGNDSVSGGDGIDSIQLGAAGGNDTLNGGAGNDTFIFTDTTFTNDLTLADVIVGGDGTDTLSFGNAAAGASATINLTTAGLLTGVSSIERLILSSTDTDQTLTIDDNIVGIAGGALAIAITQDGNATQIVVNNTLSSTSTVTTTYSATTGVLNYTIGNSIDKATGGASTDTFTLTSSAYLSVNDVINGGAGADSLTINTGVASNTFTAASLTALRNVETVTVNDNTDTDTDAYIFTLSNEVVSANYSGTSFTVTREAADDGTIRVDGSAVTGYALALNGGDGADTLIGGTGNDTIEGQSGIDVITITSGGTDRVTITDATAGNQSIITGFTLIGTATTAASGNDDLAFDEDTYFADGTFTEASTAGADVAAGNFTALTGTAAYTIVANKINVIVGKSYSSYDDMVADADSTMAAAGADALIAFYNYASQKFEIYSDLDADDNDSEVLVAALVGVTLDDGAGLTRLNFIVIE